MRARAEEMKPARGASRRPARVPLILILQSANNEHAFIIRRARRVCRTWKQAVRPGAVRHARVRRGFMVDAAADPEVGGESAADRGESLPCERQDDAGGDGGAVVDSSLSGRNSD